MITSSITLESGSTRMLASTWKVPAESQCQPVETSARWESSRESRSMKASSESTKPARIESEAAQATTRRETLGPTAMLKPRPISGVSRTSQP